MILQIYTSILPFWFDPAMRWIFRISWNNSWINPSFRLKENSYVIFTWFKHDNTHGRKQCIIFFERTASKKKIVKKIVSIFYFLKNQVQSWNLPSDLKNKTNLACLWKEEKFNNLIWIFEKKNDYAKLWVIHGYSKKSIQASIFEPMTFQCDQN